MRWSQVMCALASAAGVTALKPGNPWRKNLARYEENLANMQARGFAAAHEPHKKRQATGSPFKNNQTEKFSVDGSKLPDIDFDVGESYAGLLPIAQSNDSELFFWFFPSTNESVKNEIVIWFNGGPGCSSLSGLFEENGPVTWKPGTFAPVPNPWSWHHLSHVVWIEQPVGTGYTVGTPTYENEDDLAQQFMGFWKNFVDTFGMHNYSIYITGESYAGMYCPYVASNMLDANDPRYFNVSGMLVYDGVYGEGWTEQIPTVPFIDSLPGLFPLNDSLIQDIHKQHEDCGYADYLEQYLVYPPSGMQPSHPPRDSDDSESSMVGAGCPIPYDPLGFSGASMYNPPGAPTIYFNRTEVKEALHAPLDSDWALCKSGVFSSGDDSLPSSQAAIPHVIDQTQNVMLVHGTLDMVLMVNGTLLAIQNMTWGGKMGFQERPSSPLYVPYHEITDMGSAAGMGVYGTTHTERGLTFAAVTLSGHMVPANQPSVAFRQLEVLLGRVDSLQSQSPFTTDGNSTAQPDVEMGLGTGPQLFAAKGGNNGSGSGVVDTSGGVFKVTGNMVTAVSFLVVMAVWELFW